MQTNSISGRQEAGRGMERNIQTNVRGEKVCGRVGDKAQHRGGEVKEIKVNRQRVREREG